MADFAASSEKIVWKFSLIKHAFSVFGLRQTRVMFSVIPIDASVHSLPSGSIPSA